MTRRGFHTIELNVDADWAQWDSFVCSSMLGTVYHQSGWLSALRQGMGQDIRVHCLYEDGDIQMGGVLRVGRRFGITVGRKPWGTAYNGIVTRENTSEPLIDTFYRRIAGTYVQARLIQAPVPRSLATPSSPWSVAERVTPVVDTRDLADTWAKFDRRVRQRVRKAASEGIQVEESNDFNAFSTLYGLSYQRQGIELDLDLTALATTLTLAHANGVIRLFLARVPSGQAASGLVVGQDRHRAYFMLAGADPQFRNSDAMTLLWWRVMEILAPQCPEIDLVGLGTPGIERFKRSFSPELRPYSEAQMTIILGVPLPDGAVKRVARAVRRVYFSATGRGTEG